MEIKIERIADVEMPQYTRPTDAAFDLRSAEDLVLKPGEQKVVKTGVKIAVPDGHAGLIWDRSGIAAKQGVHVLAGVIDPGYRGEWMVVMRNFSDNDFVIEKNMRIAQVLIQPAVQGKIVEEKLDDNTHRGANGFGSSGHK